MSGVLSYGLPVSDAVSPRTSKAIRTTEQSGLEEGGVLGLSDCMMQKFEFTMEDRWVVGEFMQEFEGIMEDRWIAGEFTMQDGWVEGEFDEEAEFEAELNLALRAMSGEEFRA